MATWNDIELKRIERDLPSYYKRKAEIQVNILIFDSVIKFSIPGIITTIISIFILSPFTTNVSKDVYIGNLNPIYFWGVILLLSIIWIFGLSYIRRIQLTTLKFTTDIKIIRNESKFKELLDEAENLKRERELENFKREKKVKSENAKKMEHAKMELRYIEQLEKILKDLKSESMVKKETASQQFKDLCMDEIIRQTGNDILINKIKDCILIISLDLDDNSLNNMIGGLNDLITHSEKCTYLNLVKENIYVQIKSIVTSGKKINEPFMKNAHYIFCNIAEPIDVDVLLEPFKMLERGVGHYGDYSRQIENSLFNHNNHDGLIARIVQLLESHTVKDIGDLEGLKADVISSRRYNILTSRYIPKCKQVKDK